MEQQVFVTDTNVIRIDVFYLDSQNESLMYNKNMQNPLLNLPIDSGQAF